MLSAGAEGGMNDYFILPYYEKFQSIFIYLCTYYSLIILDYIATLAHFFFCLFARIYIILLNI